jgi:hypothetical protein
MAAKVHMAYYARGPAANGDCLPKAGNNHKMHLFLHFKFRTQNCDCRAREHRPHASGRPASRGQGRADRSVPLQFSMLMNTIADSRVHHRWSGGGAAAGASCLQPPAATAARHLRDVLLGAPPPRAAGSRGTQRGRRLRRAATGAVAEVAGAAAVKGDVSCVVLSKV